MVFVGGGILGPFDSRPVIYIKHKVMGKDKAISTLFSSNQTVNSNVLSRINEIGFT